MADEIDRGQAEGAVAKREDNLRQNTDVRASDIGSATYSDLGITRQRVAEWT